MKPFRACLFLAVPILGLTLLLQSCGSNNSNPNNPGPLPTDTPANTSTPTVNITNTSTMTATLTPTGTPTVTSTRTATGTPTGTATTTPTFTVTNTTTITATSTPSDTPTDTPTLTPTDTMTATPSSTPTGTPTDTATATSTGTPTPNATVCSVKSNFGDTFGNSAYVGQPGTSLFNYSIFSLSGTGSSTLWDMQVYLYTSVSYPATIQCAVYDQVTGYRVGVSAAQNVNTAGSYTWVVFPMTTPETIIKGRNYILGLEILNANATFPPLVGYDAVGTNYHIDNSSTTTPSSYTGGGFNYANTTSIYAEICP